MSVFEEKYGIREDNAIQRFHESRRMFCIIDGAVHLAAPNSPDSHATWFEKEGWMGRDDSAFMNTVPRGFINANGDVYFCVGYDFRVDIASETAFFAVLPELVKLLDISPTACVYGGLVKQSTGGQWPGKKLYGTIEQLTDNVNITERECATIAYYDSHAAAWLRDFEKEISPWEDQLAQFYALVPSGKVLEIGVGGGREARRGK